MNANAIPELLEWYLFLLFLIKKKKATLNLNTYLVSDTWYGNNYLFAFKRGEHLLWYSEEIKKDHPCYFPKLIIFNHFDVSKRNKEQRMTRMQQTALLMPYELLSPERKSYSQFHENSCLEKQFPAYFVLAPFPTFCKQYVPRIMPAALGQYCFKASPAVPALRTPHHMVNQGMHSPKTNKETNKGFAGDIHRSNKVYLKKKKKKVLEEGINSSMNFTVPWLQLFYNRSAVLGVIRCQPLPTEQTGAANHSRLIQYLIAQN